MDLQPKLEQAKIDNTKIMKVRDLQYLCLKQMIICSSCTTNEVIYSVSVVPVVVS